MTSKLCCTFHRLVGNCRGAAAIEFALLLPFMLTIYIGGTELGYGLSAQFKSTLAARTVADLASQYISIDAATMNGILGAASKVIAPFPTTKLAVIVSEVTTDANGKGTITWSAASNATPHSAGTTVKLPAQLQNPNVSMILGEVTFPYTPPISYAISGTFNISQFSYFFPRKTSCVTYNSVC